MGWVIPCSTAVGVLSLVLARSSTAPAQQGGGTAQPQATAPAAKPQGRAKGGSSGSKTPALKNFKAVASKLGATPEALEDQYKSAQQANPTLTRGQFVAAHMVAHDLSGKNPKITSQAILDGLKSGKSLGQTLQGLGLSADDATKAEHAANKEIKEAKAERKAAKGAKQAGQATKKKELP
jgi:hypothetical protein